METNEDQLSSDDKAAIAISAVEDMVNLSSEFSDAAYSIVRCKGDGSCLMHATSPANLFGLDSDFRIIIAQDYRQKRQNVISAMREDIILLKNPDNIRDTNDFDGISVARVKGFAQALGEHYYDDDPGFVSDLIDIASIEKAEDLNKFARENSAVWQKFIERSSVMVDRFSNEVSFLPFNPCCFYLADINKNPIAVRESGNDRHVTVFFPKGVEQNESSYDLYKDNITYINFTRNYDHLGNDAGSHFDRMVSREQWSQMLDFANKRFKENKNLKQIYKQTLGQRNSNISVCEPAMDIKNESAIIEPTREELLAFTLRMIKKKKLEKMEIYVINEDAFERIAAENLTKQQQDECIELASNKIDNPDLLPRIKADYINFCKKQVDQKQNEQRFFDFALEFILFGKFEEKFGERCDSEILKNIRELFTPEEMEQYEQQARDLISDPAKRQQIEEAHIDYSIKNEMKKTAAIFNNLTKTTKDITPLILSQQSLHENKSDNNKWQDDVNRRRSNSRSRTPSLSSPSS